MKKTQKGTRSDSQVVFVTGGASGIGFETARRLAERGYTIALVDIRAEEVTAAAAKLGGHHIGLSADVSNLSSLEQAAAETVRRLGKIDVVVANAGIGSASTVRASSAEQLLRILDINLAGQVRTVKATLEYVIAQRGYYAFTCSASVLKYVPRSSAYAAAKSGVEAFAGALRLEVMHQGVQVGVFYPGWTRTAMIQGPASRSEASKGLPWPLNIKNDVEDVAAAYADAIDRRARTSYFPKIHRAVHWMRPFYTNALWDQSQRAQAARDVALLEADFLAQNDNSQTGRPTT